MTENEDEEDMPELVVAVLIGSISEVVEEEEEGTTKFEAGADKACSCVACAVLCDVGLLALLEVVLASVPETFRLNEVRAWATPNKSSPWKFAFVVEASEWTVPSPELMIVAVAFPQAESTGQLDVEFCAEAAFMMKSILMPERSAW